MKLILATIFFLVLANMLTVTFNAVYVAHSQGDVSMEILDETGTYFELQNSSFSITTDATVHIILMASSKMIGCLIENASVAASTQLTLGNLNPSTTYYMYEDSYINENIFTTDDVGSYTYTQDLSKTHQVFIQTNSSTIVIGESTTLQSDIYDNVVIIADNIVLDLNGYSIVGDWDAWTGIDIYSRYNVTIKNGGIRNFYFSAIDCVDSTNIMISDNTIGTNLCTGIYLSYSTTMISNNVINNQIYFSGIYISMANYNIIMGNTFFDGIDILLSYGNKICHNNFINCGASGGAYSNIWDDGYPSGGNFWSYYTGVDLYSGPYQNEAGSDGIGDTPYVINLNNIDKYPFMEESGWITPPLMIEEEIQVIESWELDSGIEESLTSKLEAAIILLDRENFNGAVHVLQALIKVVTNDAKHLTQEQKDYIVEATYEIIGRIWPV